MRESRAKHAIKGKECLFSIQTEYFGNFSNSAIGTPTTSLNGEHISVWTKQLKYWKSFNIRNYCLIFCDQIK